MILGSAVVLDANVLATFTVADLLLRLAEAPRAFRPFWSEAILEEVRRTHVVRLGWPPEVAESFGVALRTHFPEAMVRGYEVMLGRCANDSKDRHVLACAIQAQANLILTYNLADFPASALAPHGIHALHPAAFLRDLRSARRRARAAGDGDDCGAARPDGSGATALSPGSPARVLKGAGGEGIRCIAGALVRWDEGEREPGKNAELGSGGAERLVSWDELAGVSCLG